MIPIDEFNTLNLKLFPAYPPPPPLAPHYVPLATVRLSALTDENWDLTMLRILPFIDGVRSIRAISREADADYKLVRKAIAHLVYYGCVMILDVFHFGASYAPTADMSSFVIDSEMQEEARGYVLSPDITGKRLTIRDSINTTRLVELYCSLKQGLSVRSWCLENAEVVGVLDVRRFITFGVIKGILYRVHKYAVATGSIENAGELEKFLDGTHCFDEICTELIIGERELLTRLKVLGDIQIIQR